MQNEDNSLKDPNTLAIEKNPCSLCKAFKLSHCDGHAAPAGDYSNSPVNNAGEAKGKDHKIEKIMSGIFLFFYVREPVKGSIQVANQQGIILNNIPTELRSVLAKLIKILDQLAIHYDEKRQTLTIEPKSGSATQQILEQFLKLLKQTSFDFLKEQGYAINKDTVDLSGNKLIIHVKDKELHQKLMTRLATYSPALLQQAELEENKQNNAYKSPSPFGNMNKGPLPKGYKE
jgi:hypothetical protein